MSSWQWDYIATFIPDIIQIAILYFAIYAILKSARGSRFGQVLLGIGILFMLLIAFTQLFDFKVLSIIVRWLLVYLAMSSVVIFQPEIRRALATMGAFIFSDRNTRQREFSPSSVTAESLADIILSLAAKRTGALIAFERGISLRSYQSNGVALDALVSPELFLSIFTEPMPLHDGGVVIRHRRIAAAHCLFPVSAKHDLSASGMRHRAAVGLSEETDALVIVVSEETGRISVAHNGKLIRYTSGGPDTRSALLRWLRKMLPETKSAWDTIADWLRKRSDRKRAAATAASSPPPQNHASTHAPKGADK